MSKFAPSLVVAVVACLAPLAAEARPRDGKVVIRPDRVTVRAPRGSVLVPVPPVAAVPGVAPVPAVAVVPRRLTPCQAAKLAVTPPPVIPLAVPSLLVPAVPVVPQVAVPQVLVPQFVVPQVVVPQVAVPQPAPVVVPPAAQPVFSAVRAGGRTAVVARPPAARAPARFAAPAVVQPVVPVPVTGPAADGTQSILVTGEQALESPAATQAAESPIELLPTP